MSDKKKKQRQAAIKAWQTIKKRRRESRVKGVEKITRWISRDEIGRISHPEITACEISDIWEGNGVVKQFSKTPSDIACGPFWELRWAYGCPLNCSYCYLRGTMRGRTKPSFVRIEEIERCVREAFQKIKSPQIFNSGELSDSLMNPALMECIVDIFEKQDKHKIYLLSKYGTKNIGFLLEKPRKQVICGWSINPNEIARRWEKGAASTSDRIEAASLVWEAGYDTRIRLDPIFPVENWESKYECLLNEIFSALLPNRIILGTPRGLWKTISYAKKAGVDMSWTKYFSENSGWGKKISFESRKEIYSFFFEKLKSYNFPTHKISICKETQDMWKELGLEIKINKCKCYGDTAITP